MNKWEAARNKLYGKEYADKQKIRFAEEWLDAHFDALCANGQGGKALDAISRYERLCDDFRNNYGCWEHEYKPRKGGRR